MIYIHYPQICIDDPSKLKPFSIVDEYIYNILYHYLINHCQREMKNNQIVQDISILPIELAYDLHVLNKRL